MFMESLTIKPTNVDSMCTSVIVTCTTGRCIWKARTHTLTLNIFIVPSLLGICSIFNLLYKEVMILMLMMTTTTMMLLMMKTDCLCDMHIWLIVWYAWLYAYLVYVYDKMYVCVIYVFDWLWMWYVNMIDCFICMTVC